MPAKLEIADHLAGRFLHVQAQIAQHIDAHHAVAQLGLPLRDQPGLPAVEAHHVDILRRHDERDRDDQHDDHLAVRSHAEHAEQTVRARHHRDRGRIHDHGQQRKHQREAGDFEEGVERRADKDAGEQPAAASAPRARESATR